MTSDESRVFVKLIHFSLDQAELISMLTTTVFQWMNNQESMQAVRDEMLKGLALGDKSEDLVIIASRLSELTHQATLIRPAMTKSLLDRIAKSKSAQDELAAALVRWKRASES
jgi:tryptophanyl-tRNA synthetase